MNEPLAIAYKMTLAGEYHVGSGFGLPGVADSFIVKDFKGRLFVKGDTIKGIIRDAAERLLDIVGEEKCDGDMGKGQGNLCGVTTDSKCLICRIFGSPYTAGSFWFEDAVFEPNYRMLIAAEEFRDQALKSQTIISMHNMIDRFTGRAREDYLFSVEMGRNKDGFYGTIQEILVEVDAEIRLHQLALLTAALRFATHFGHRRRRGIGICRFSLVNDITVNGLCFSQAALIGEFKRRFEHGAS